MFSLCFEVSKLKYLWSKKDFISLVHSEVCLSLLIIILGESGKTHGNKSSKKRKKPQHPNSYPSGKILRVPNNNLACQQLTVDQWMYPSL